MINIRIYDPETSSFVEEFESRWEYSVTQPEIKQMIGSDFKMLTVTRDSEQTTIAVTRLDKPCEV